MLLSTENIIFTLESDTRINPEILWVKQSKAPIYSKPLVKDDILYVGDLLNNFYALRSYTGKTLWHKKLKARVDNKPKGIKSSFLIYNKSIIVVTVDGFLYSFHYKTGDIIWGPFDLGEAVYSSPVINGEYIFIITGETGKVFVIEALSGIILSKEPISQVVYTTPVIIRAKTKQNLAKAYRNKELYELYITLPSKLLIFLLDIERQEQIQRKTIYLSNTSKYISNPIIYFATSKSAKKNIKKLFFASPGLLYSVNLNRLKIDWIVRANALEINKDTKYYPAPFVEKDLVHFASISYKIDKGTPFWNVFLYGKPTSDLAYSENYTYIGGKYIYYGKEVGYISALDRKTESLVFTKTLLSPPLSPIVVHDRTIFLSAENNKLYALK